MNWRLLTDQEKRANAVARQRRKDARRRGCRRGKLFDQISHSLGGVHDLRGLITPQEAFTIYCGPLQSAKLIARRMARQAIDLPPAVKEMSLEQQCERPERVLRRSRRSRAYPAALLRVAAAPCVSLPAAIENAKAALRRGASTAVILDYWCCANGVEFEDAGEILMKMGLLPTPVSPVEIEQARLARNFWHWWRTGNTRYAAAVAIKHCSGTRGDWGWFEHRELMVLLPGLKLPQALTRSAYLACLVTEPDGTLVLDLYSSNQKPLVRHPFTKAAAVLASQS